MENTFWTAFGASSLAALVTAVGIYTVRHFEAWPGATVSTSSAFICFAAGVLISVSFLHIIPKSIAMNVHAPAYLLTGFVLMHLFNRFITAFVCERDPDSPYGIDP